MGFFKERGKEAMMKGSQVERMQEMVSEKVKMGRTDKKRWAGKGAIM
jgi:hypothetical protein